MFHGTTVTALEDGNVVTTHAVGAGGSFTLGEEIDTSVGRKEIVVGLPYTSKMQTLPIDTAGQAGAGIGDAVRIDRINIILYHSYTGKFGSDSANLEDIVYPSTPYSGGLIFELPSTPDRLGQVIIETDTPYPLTVLGMTLRGDGNKG